MEPTHNSGHDRTPQRPTQPLRPRPLINDFGPRPTQQPIARSTESIRPMATPPPHTHAHSTQSAVLDLRSTTPTPSTAMSQSAQRPAVPPLAPTPPPAPTNKPSKPRNTNGHAGLVGLVLFIVLTALAVAPVLPGKITQDFPGSSQSLSSGNQGLACIRTPEHATTTTSYHTKLGFPLVYKYTTISIQHATCDGKDISAIGGTAGQFNPLGLVIDVLAALIIAVGISKLWRLFYRLTHSVRSHSPSRGATSGPTSGGSTVP